MHPYRLIAGLSALSLLSYTSYAQSDPGPRPQSAPSALYLPGLTPYESQSFQEGLNRFNEIDSVSGTEAGATGRGLGPRYNLNSCSGCHAYPTVGGSSPRSNPQVEAATHYGARNTLPSFIDPSGPIREVRFVNNSNGTPDGGVHSLFVISGRPDAGGCNITQPNFAQAVVQHNAIFRIPTPLFGAGLIASIPDAAILANESANSTAKLLLGISGHENRSGNDGTITRFGWKAQNKSPEIFGGEAYNVEQGVTNELFPTERDETPGCALNGLPEDATDFSTGGVLGMSDTVGFSYFMRYLAPPAPAPSTASTLRGQTVFSQVGCYLCHTPSLNTDVSSSAALQGKPVALYSDLLVHNMGIGLADGITQGTANGNQFRTAPLWGLGQRLFFLHDGRTSDLQAAILAHNSLGSEAFSSATHYLLLSPSSKQDLLNFLRSL